ncbi:MAG: zinc ribbon domain-containing protein [Actinobacteria bacterium]|nr:zinc ribbon domain-containing protein [Actinomycetota bacterium]
MGEGEHPGNAAHAAEQESQQRESLVVTASERVLAWILAGFLLMALSWAYVNVDDAVRDTRGRSTDAAYRALHQIRSEQESNERSLGLWDKLSVSSVDDQQTRLSDAEDNRDVARERYRTELDAGNKNAKLRAAYAAAEVQVTKQRAALGELKVARLAALKKQTAYMESTAAARRHAQQRLEARDKATGRWIFFLRALLVLGALGLSVGALRWITERSPRTQPLAQASVTASALMVLTMIIDYSEISFDFDTLGPLGLAALGSAITIGAFFGLQRYLARRRPLRRLRAGECRRCGYPAKDVAFCEGCGAHVFDSCDRCGKPRRVGTPHCRSCGAA